MFQPTADAILFRLSDGAERHKGGGQFKVVYRRNEEKTFTKLVDAFLFYLSLDEEADLLETSNGDTLVERKIQVCLN